MIHGIGISKGQAKEMLKTIDEPSFFYANRDGEGTKTAYLVIADGAEVKIKTLQKIVKKNIKKTIWIVLCTKDGKYRGHWTYDIDPLFTAGDYNKIETISENAKHIRDMISLNTTSPVIYWCRDCGEKFASKEKRECPVCKSKDVRRGDEW